MTTTTIWSTWLERVAAAKEEAKKTHLQTHEWMQAKQKVVEGIAAEVGGKQVMFAMMLGVLSHPDVPMEMKVEVARVWSKLSLKRLDWNTRELVQGSWQDAFGGMLDAGEEDVVVVGARAIKFSTVMDPFGVDETMGSYLSHATNRSKLVRLLQSESAKKQDAAMVALERVWDRPDLFARIQHEHGAVVETAIANVMAQQQQHDDNNAMVVMKMKKHAANLVVTIISDSDQKAEFATSLHTNHGAAVRQGLVGMLQTTAADMRIARFAAYQAIQELSLWCDGFVEALAAEHGDVLVEVLMQALERRNEMENVMEILASLAKRSKTFAEAVNKRHGVVLRKMLVEGLEEKGGEKLWFLQYAQVIGWMAKQSVPFVIALEAEHYGKRVRAALVARVEYECDDNAFAICELAEQSSMFAINLDEEHGVEVRQKLMKPLQVQDKDRIPLQAVRAVGAMSRKAPAFGRAFLVEHLDVRERLEAVQHLEEEDEEDGDDVEDMRWMRERNVKRRETAVAAREAVAALEDAVAEGKDPMIKSAAKRAKTDEDF